jgi:hypothetical protein
MHARVLAEANGWCTLITNSAKLVNIIADYGYEPVLAPMDRCIRGAIAGRTQRCPPEFFSRVMGSENSLCRQDLSAGRRSLLQIPYHSPDTQTAGPVGS